MKFPKLALATLLVVGGLACGTEGEAPGPGAPAEPAVAERAEAEAPAANDFLAGLRARQAELQRKMEEDPAGTLARIEAAEVELREQLGDPDPEVRARAVSFVDLEEGDARQRVIELAHSDPEAEVRIAAAEALAFDGTLMSVAGLLPMLDDADPAVVAAAIEGLEDAGDESVVPPLERLYEHPDPAVGERAREAVDYLR